MMDIAQNEETKMKKIDRYWLKNYPEGVPAEIDCNCYATLVALLEEAFRNHRDQPAYACMDVKIDYGEADRLSAAIGAWLQAEGFGRGTRVAIMMPNILPLPIVLAGALRAGCTVVNVNPLYTPRELEHQLTDSGAEVVFVLENFANTLEKVPDHTRLKRIVVVSMGDLLGAVKGALVNLVVRHVKKMVPAWRLPGSLPFSAVLAAGLKKKLKPVSLTHDDIAFLQYTGGTTGVAKGAMLTHRNVIANVLQCEAWYQPALKLLAPGAQALFITALPLYHVFALTVCGMLCARLGGQSVLIPNPRDIPGFVKELAKHRFNIFPGVNTLFNALLHNEDFLKLDFSSLVASIGGGMAVQRAVAERWRELTGTPICEGYGLSETSPVVSGNRIDLEEYTGTIGLPLPSTEVIIVDDEGKAQPIGEAGEIAVRGPQVMAGYWQHPEDTAKVMLDDGFLRTGDIGVMDARGYIRVVDRKKDMILVSGFNVYPNEIEEVMATHPGVLESAVIGVPDEHSGEAVKLFIVRKDPALTEAQVVAFCREHLAGYKRPKHIQFRDSLPKTNVGKILRRQLRDE
jgi:long-chain acyl-CoA synthetase